MDFEETKQFIEATYNIIEYNNGHIKHVGKQAGVLKNPFWRVMSRDCIHEIILMYCETNSLFQLCPVSYQKIINYETNNNCKITWSKCKNGYIIGNNKLYVHQIITGCYGNGKGTNNISVDHIDQNPLNNSWDNLRIATREEQEQNSKGIKPGTKRERKQSAKPLPEGITQHMMLKYVVYYHEWLDKEKTKYREFFKIEKHPKLDKIWIGCKSNKVSIQEKLNSANKVVQDLDNDIYPVKEHSQLPKYVSLINFREKPHLVFDKRYNGKRLNLKMVLPNEYDIHEQIMLLQIKVCEKYGETFIETENTSNGTYNTEIDNTNEKTI